MYQLTGLIRKIIMTHEKICTHFFRTIYHQKTQFYRNNKTTFTTKINAAAAFVTHCNIHVSCVYLFN